MTEKRNPSKLYDVAVIGAGPSGLTAALAFAQRGLDTLLLAPDVNHSDGRTTALLQESVAFLETLDVWAKLATKAAPLRRMRLIDDTGRLIRAPAARRAMSDPSRNGLLPAACGGSFLFRT